MENEYTGIVKRFEHGYGFIKRDDGAKDVFVHFQNISQLGFRNLKVGQRVIFELGLGPKELMEAKNVRENDNG